MPPKTNQEKLILKMQANNAAQEVVELSVAWVFLKNWLSNSNDNHAKGSLSANLQLSSEKSSTFAFFHKPLSLEYRDTFFILLQPPMYEALTKIGINQVILEKDGFTISISEFRKYELLISSFSFKVMVASNLHSDLEKACLTCDKVQFGMIEYNSNKFESGWALSKTDPFVYPLTSSKKRF